MYIIEVLQNKLLKKITSYMNFKLLILLLKYFVFLKKNNRKHKQSVKKLKNDQKRL